MKVLSTGSGSERRRQIHRVSYSGYQYHRGKNEIGERDRRPGYCAGFAGNDKDPRADKDSDYCGVAFDFGEFASKLDALRDFFSNRFRQRAHPQRKLVERPGRILSKMNSKAKKDLIKTETRESTGKHQNLSRILREKRSLPRLRPLLGD